MMSQACRKSISTITIQLYSKTLRATWKKARKRKMHVELESVHLQYLLSLISLGECFAKKKSEQHFHDHVVNDYSREYKSRWSVKTIRMAFVGYPHNPSIIEYMHPKCLAT